MEGLGKEGGEKKIERRRRDRKEKIQETVGASVGGMGWRHQ